MKWIRSNLGFGSRLALFAFAMQFLLSFGHFHGFDALPDLAGSKRSGFHSSANLLAALPYAAHGALQAKPRAEPKSSDHPAEFPVDHCAICAITALVGSVVVPTAPGLLDLETAGSLYATSHAGLDDPISAGSAYQPRAPPAA